jgi:putative sugar O-methyltransferase
MKLKLRHLRHPLQTANAAKALVEARLKRRRFADRSERYFADDPRYDVQSVIDGFADRVDDRSDDAALLGRICTSYIKAAKQEQSAPKAYRPTGWWEQQRHGSLGAVTKALMTRDIDALQAMYRNFYRDPCSAGLVVLQSMSKDYFGGTIRESHRRFYLADALYRIDHWKAQTGSSFNSRDLSGPEIGNPFGVMVEGTLIRSGAEYQHYCALRIRRLLAPERAVVAEIGGGFGGMAYYLLRDRARTTYINFDVPESVALMSYYLLKAFPQLKFLLYGEEELSADAIAHADGVLMPVFELAKMPVDAVDVTFSSHAMSDLSHEAMGEYLKTVASMTRDSFLYIGNDKSGDVISDLITQQYPSFRLAETRTSGWHSHRAPGSSEVECLYRIDGV